MMWKSDDKDFQLTEVPGKWKNESAVILAKSMEYQVKKEVLLKILHENLYIHRRIKILDEAAVKEFSEISFESSQYNMYQQGNQSEVFVGVKVVKSNGKEKEINTADAVKMEAQNGKSSANYNKLAIPDLEPGDILDYYHCIETQFLAYSDFDRILYPLAEQYPIVKQRVDLHIMRKCDLTAKSLNGAPQLKQNSNLNDKNVYSLVMEHTEKVDTDQRWFYSNRSVPTINFQTFYGRRNLLQNYARGQDAVTSKISEKALLKYSNHLASEAHKFESIFSHDHFPFTTLMKRHITINHKKEKDPEKIIKYAYYHLRQKRFAAGYEDQLLNNSPYNYGLKNYYFITDMSRFLKKNKIDHDLIIACPRAISDIDDLVLDTDLYWMIRVNTPKPFFISEFDRFSFYNDLAFPVLGSNAYAVDISKKKKYRTIKKIELPATSYLDNKNVVDIQVEILSENPEHIHVKRNVYLTGFNRYTEFNPVLTPYDYLEDGDLKKHKIVSSGEEVARKKLRAEYAQKVTNRKEQDNKDREEAMKGQIEEQFASKIITYHNFKLLQTGIWDEKPSLKYEDDFTLEGLSVKNGQNYLIEAGKLISQQIALGKEELKRKDDIYMPYPRSFEYNITIEIPDGYEVKGLEKFNVNVKNATGGFTSKAEIKGQKLVINTLKYYSNNFEKAEKLPEIAAFLDAAYNFTLQKLLFSKINSKKTGLSKS